MRAWQLTPKRAKGVLNLGFEDLKAMRPALLFVGDLREFVDVVFNFLGALSVLLRLFVFGQLISGFGRWAVGLTQLELVFAGRVQGFAFLAHQA